MGQLNVSVNARMEIPEKSLDIEKVLNELREINSKQEVKNLNIFGPVTNETIVIVVQVKKVL